MEAKTGYEAGLNEYVKQEKAAVELITAVGTLMYNKGVELVLFRNHLVDINSSELIENVDILPSILSSCNIEFDKDSIDGKLPRELGGDGKDFIFTESIYPGQTYKASIKDGVFECFLEGNNLTNDCGTIDINEYYFTVEDIKTGDTISDERIIKRYLLEFEKILNIEINYNSMLKYA